MKIGGISTSLFLDVYITIFAREGATQHMYIQGGNYDILLVRILPKLIFLGPNETGFRILMTSNIVELIFLGSQETILTSVCIVSGYFMFMYRFISIKKLLYFDCSEAEVKQGFDAKKMYTHPKNQSIPLKTRRKTLSSSFSSAHTIPFPKYGG